MYVEDICTADEEVSSQSETQQMCTVIEIAVDSQGAEISLPRIQKVQYIANNSQFTSRL